MEKEKLSLGGQIASILVKAKVIEADTNQTFCGVIDTVFSVRATPCNLDKVEAIAKAINLLQKKVNSKLQKVEEIRKNNTLTKQKQIIADLEKKLKEANQNLAKLQNPSV